MKLIIKRLSFKKNNKFHIFIKHKHKHLELLAILKLQPNTKGRMYLKINYNLLFKVYKIFTIRNSAFENLNKLYTKIK
jgi:hypothetical protein